MGGFRWLAGGRVPPSGSHLVLRLCLTVTLRPIAP